MNAETVNNRVYYRYFDNYKMGYKTGFIDIDMPSYMDARDFDIHKLRGFVLRKWKNTGYVKGDLSSVEIDM